MVATYIDGVNSNVQDKSKRNIPKGVLVIKTHDMSGLRNVVQSWRKELEKNPNYIPVLAIPPSHDYPKFIKIDDAVEEFEVVHADDDFMAEMKRRTIK